MDQWIPQLADLLGDTAEVVDRAHGGAALCDWLEEQETAISLEPLGAWRYALLIADELVAAGWLSADAVSRD
jgi:hypothetical protein